ncbi:MAG: hypothetical protein AMS27_08785 [Bacteroides sp. SM23_62_1]|nr:MAG: hypothetical protein AMS27_08785 [Bacteroides sp. SM23_62_1]
MKKLIPILVGFFFLGINVVTLNAQDWIKQSPIPTANTPNDIYCADSNTIIVCCPEGIFKTVNRGLSWSESTKESSNSIISFYFLDKQTGWGVGSNLTIMKTTDGGASWSTQKEIETDTSDLNSVCFSDINNGWIAGGDGTVLYTSDGGINWNKQITNTTNDLKAIHFADSQNGYCIGTNIVLKTNNGGTVWDCFTNITDLTTGEDVYCIDADTCIIMAVSKVFRTTDGGANWTSQDYTSGWFKELDFINSKHGFMVGHCGYGTYTCDVFLGCSWSDYDMAIWETKDGGISWDRTIFSDTYDYLFDVSVVDSNIICASGTGGFIIQTLNNGDAWYQISKGTSKSLYASQFITSQLGYCSGEGGIIMVTPDAGENWIKQYGYGGSYGGFYSIQFINSNTGWVVGNSGRIRKTFNNGSTWNYQSCPVSKDLLSVNFIDSLKGYIVGKDGTILKTTNSGSNWIQQTSGVSDDLYSVYFNDEQSGWTVGGKGLILKTVNGGDTWIQKTSNTSHNLNSVYIKNAQEGWAVGASGTIVKTTDGGESWIRLYSGLDGNLNSIYFLDENTGWIVGTNGIIIRTTDGGNSWAVNESLDSYTINSIYFADINTGWVFGNKGLILKTTNGGGTFDPLTLYNVPQLLLPEDDSTNIPLDPSLIWASIDGVSSYKLQVSKYSSFSSTIIDEGGITDTSYALAGLEDDRTYYWRVCAEYGGGINIWCESYSFRTLVLPPSAPILSSPGNGAEGIERAVLLEWSVEWDADSYYFQVSESEDFLTLVCEDSIMDYYPAEAQIGPLNASTTYYWRVRAMNTGGTSPYSEIYSFTTGLYIINPPSLNSPDDGSEGIDRVVMLEWSIDWDADSYHFQVSENEGFSTVVFEDSVLDNYPAEAQIGPLDASTTYYWRVKIKKGDYTSPYSQTFSFTTGLYIISPPSLISPADESEGIDRVVTLEWSIDWEADSYHFQVSESEDFSTLVSEDSILDNYPAEIQIGPLDESTTYYWRVKIKKGDYLSPYSEVYSFTTGIYIIKPPSLISPADVSEGVDQVVMLKWSIDWEADSYHFQVSELEDFSTVVIEDSIMDNYPAEAEVGPLGESTTYYWRVKIKKGDYASSYSEVYSFTTSLSIINPPSTPNLYSPYNGQEAQSGTPELDWSYTSNTDAYHIQVAKDSNFTELVFNDSTITETFQIIGPLESMTTYYWHVRAKNAGGYSPYSEVYYFITENPDLFYQASYCIYSLYFTDDNTGWAAGGEGYVYKTEDSGASWDILETGTTEFLSDIFFIDSNTGWAVGNNGTIIKTIDGGNHWVSQNSETTYRLESVFFIDMNTGFVVGDNGIILKTTDGGTYWIKQNSNESYVLKTVYFIDENVGWAAGINILQTNDGGNTWTNCAPEWGGIINSSFFIDDNEGWLVGFDGEILKTNDGGTTWTNQNSGTAEILNDVFFHDNNIGWAVGNEGTVIKTADGGVNWVPLESGNTDILKGVYFVNQDTGWVGGICAIYKSETGIGDIQSLSMPQLISPTNNSIDIPLNVSLSWETVENAESYRLQVSDNDDFISPVYDQSGIETTSQQVGGLDNNTTYYWRVNAAKGKSMISPWSETWNFTTRNSVGINESGYDIQYKVYPNPVYDKLFIEGFENELTSISILSLEGKLLKQIKEKGMIQIDVSDLQNGLYLVKIVNSKIMITERLVKQ